MESMLQVQKEAPVDLLLGTDLLPQLGFLLVQMKGKHMTDLLKPTTQREAGIKEISNPEAERASCHEVRMKLPQAAPAQPEALLGPKVPSATVKLIQATRLPPRHSKLVRAVIDGPRMDSEVCVFEPTIPSLTKKGLSMADAVVGNGDGGGGLCWLLPIWEQSQHIWRLGRYSEGYSQHWRWKTWPGPQI